ncbi:hypothetical protein [Oleiharenicola lentus]|uniref:hypothetical protein n=1 Tax=Oleiharenicola lentus TaxID=2508720 RepID=UPI003F67FAFF
MMTPLDRAEVQRVIGNFHTEADYRREMENWPLEWFDYASQRMQPGYFTLVSDGIERRAWLKEQRAQRIKSIEREEAETAENRRHTQQIDVAKEANEISRTSNRLSIFALIISIAAAGFSLWVWYYPSK